MNEEPETMREWLELIDMSSIALPDDKLLECQYFLSLASAERDKDKFRWLISAFFNAAYSFFEIAALDAHHRYYDPDTDKHIEDDDSLNVLREHVGVKQNPKRPKYVNTSGLSDLTKKLYELRKGNTHHSPMTITQCSDDLPEGYNFGYIKNEGMPALKFCRDVLELIETINKDIST